MMDATNALASAIKEAYRDGWPSTLGGVSLPAVLEFAWFLAEITNDSLPRF